MNRLFDALHLIFFIQNSAKRTNLVKPIWSPDWFSAGRGSLTAADIGQDWWPLYSTRTERSMLLACRAWRLGSLLSIFCRTLHRPASQRSMWLPNVNETESEEDQLQKQMTWDYAGHKLPGHITPVPSRGSGHIRVWSPISIAVSSPAERDHCCHHHHQHLLWHSFHCPCWDYDWRLVDIETLTGMIYAQGFPWTDSNSMRVGRGLHCHLTQRKVNVCMWGAHQRERSCATILHNCSQGLSKEQVIIHY